MAVKKDKGGERALRSDAKTGSAQATGGSMFTGAPAAGQTAAPAGPEGPAAPGPDGAVSPASQPAPQASAEPASDADRPAEAPTEPGFPIVGIGASAGGLAAFEAFLSALPVDAEPGMAFVLVQHLSPDHRSILSELCGRITRMEVQEVQDGLEVLPNRLYVIPPNCDMAILEGRFHLLEPAAPRGLRLPIDFFFRSLAQECRERAIAVVLSGTGTDGTLGARAIKGAGGLVIAQTPESAGYDGMPRSAIATGLTDFVLPPAEMPAQILDYVAHAFGRITPRRGAPAPGPEDTLKRVCILLRDRTGHDFSQYKQSTVNRRIERRMALHRIEQRADYLRYLQQDPGESDALFRDLLIGVTSFFRDPEAFAALETKVIPRLFAGKPAGATVRVWVCGCSTGEEAYSIAILLQEHLETLRQGFKVQVFATDVDPGAIEQARRGAYPASIAADVTPERLARHFMQEGEDGAYRVQKVIRDLLVFSEQDLIRDPPFSRLDLISCRNLLIYMNGELQKRLIPLFHYALNPDGVLFLGTSETVGDAPGLFTALSRKWKIYVRHGYPVGAPAQALIELLPPSREGLSAPRGGVRDEGRAARSDFGRLMEHALLAHFAPVALLIDARGEILHICGRTGYYLEPAPGDAQLNLLVMAREGLRRELTVALHRAVARKEPVWSPGVRVKTNGDYTVVNLTVRPADLAAGDGAQDLYLVVLEAVPLAPAPLLVNTTGEAPPTREHDVRVAELELELRAKEEYLQTTLEEMETSNEELKSANEEMQSVNEELQSTNEELETSKEELQSVNEELATVNVELQTKVADLSRANNDMNNLLAGTGVATLFVDHQLRITRFTPAATQLIKLIGTDVGRPVGDLVSNLIGYDRLSEDTHAVLKTLVSKEQEVQTKGGDWYLMRIGPYRTLENVIEGAVITFVDITWRKCTELDLGRARERAEAVVEALPEALLGLDANLRVVLANQHFCRTFGLTRDEALGHDLRDLAGGRWNRPDLLARIAEVRAGGADPGEHPPAGAAGTGAPAQRIDCLRLDGGADGEAVLLVVIREAPVRDEPAGPAALPGAGDVPGGTA